MLPYTFAYFINFPNLNVLQVRIIIIIIIISSSSSSSSKLFP